jgi:hypothetical protein
MSKTQSTVSVSFDEMLNLLEGVEKGQLCSVHFVTEPEMLKGGRLSKKVTEYPNKYLDRVKKDTSGTFTCGNSYVDRVKREMVKQGLNPETWVIEPSKVGVHTSKCVTYNDNTGNSHFQLEIHKDNPHNHVKSFYLVDGQTIDQLIFSQFSEYIVKHSRSQKQLINGIPDTVVLFSPSIKNIKDIVLKGTKYVLQDV